MQFLTTISTAELSESIADAINAAMSLVAIAFVIRILALIGIVALITWVVKKVWHAGEGKDYSGQYRRWKKYEKQFRKQEKREEAARMAYQEYYARERHEEWLRKQREGKPDPSKGFENNPDWVWDEKAQLWRHIPTSKKRLEK